MKAGNLIDEAAERGIIEPVDNSYYRPAADYTLMLDDEDQIAAIRSYEDDNLLIVALNDNTVKSFAFNQPIHITVYKDVVIRKKVACC